MRYQWVLLLVTLAGRATCDTDAPCYYPTGNLALGFYPCDPTAYITMCCPQGYTCFSNSLCVATMPNETFPDLVQGTALRGACTNPLWNDAICGNECLDGANAGGDLVACGNNRFCCSGDYDDGSCDCSSDGDSFYVEAGIAQTIIGVSWTTFTGSPSYLVTATGFSSGSSQTLSSFVTSTTDDASSSTTTSAVGTTSHSSSLAAETTSQTTSQQTSSSASHSSRTSSSSTSTSSPTGAASGNGADGEPSIGVKAGLGVGIPFLVAGVVALSYFLYRRRKDRLAAQQSLAAEDEEQEPYVDHMREFDQSYPRYSDPHAFDPGHSVPTIPSTNQGPSQPYHQPNIPNASQGPSQPYYQPGVGGPGDSGPPPASPWERQVRFDRR